MRKQRGWLLGVVLGLSLVLAGPASAWEFVMDGAFTWEYDVRGQLGSNGFFGQYNHDNGASTLGRAASLNGWLGQQFGDTVSGTDGSLNIQYMLMNMDLMVNPAIRVRGAYYIGEWRETGFGDGTAIAATVASQYQNERHPGVQRSFSPGYWQTLWATVQLPWGALTVGKRPFIFGTGLQWNGEENRSNENAALTADYGPLRFQIAVAPSRRARNVVTLATPVFGINTADGTTATIANFDYYNNDFDKTNTRIWDLVLPAVTYRNGPLEAGILTSFVRTHAGPEGKLLPTDDGTILSKARTRTLDRNDFFGGVYVKYNNGRFFFNSEFDWYNRVDRFSGPALPIADTTLVQGHQLSLPVYIEAYRVMAEAGAFCGPAKVSFLYAWMNGPDRRNGSTFGINQGGFIDHVNPTFLNPNPKLASQADANTGVFRPYSLMMVYGYGLGAYINVDSGNGFADDASILAARADYAIAANLNVWGSFMWADRVGNGYGWGYLSPLTTTAAAWSGTAATGNNGPSGQIVGHYRGSNVPGSGTAIAPNIPDNNLGWEVTTGFDWKLLENLTATGTFGYWQPGKWFNYACIDRGVFGWDTQNSVDLATGATTGVFPFGANPSRTIDPLWAMEFKLNHSF